MVVTFTTKRGKSKERHIQKYAIGLLKAGKMLHHSVLKMDLRKQGFKLMMKISKVMMIQKLKLEVRIKIYKKSKRNFRTFSKHLK